MGKVKWGGGLSGSDFDNADRSNSFKPYDGPPVPTNTLFCWKIKVLKRGKTTNGYDQLIVGLELTPRRSRPDEKPYAGFYITDYITVMEDSLFRVAPFLDAIGVSGTDFAERTIVEQDADRRGSRAITKIGRWINNGKNYVMATTVDGDDGKGNPRRKVGNYWPIPEAEDSEAEEESDSENDWEEEEQPRPAKKATKKAQRPAPEGEGEDDEEPTPRKAAKKTTAKKATGRSRRDADEDEGEDDDPPF